MSWAPLNGNGNGNGVGPRNISSGGFHPQPSLLHQQQPPQHQSHHQHPQLYQQHQGPPASNSSTVRLGTPTSTSTTRLATPTHSTVSAMSATSTADPPMSRAERFEDEKKRIVDSLFSKLDGNGQLAESYIIHVRIQEDSASPSAPSAPENSRPENIKPRLIIIAVRSTGRVRIHKARENANGSFSIGKTWNLEELHAIETYSGSPNTPPQTEQEAQYRAWAGSIGFVVDLGKRYYWQAGTTKEKDFFIASLVKIYRRYTKGNLPQLIGFDDRAQAALLGLSPGQQPPPVQQGPPQMGSRVQADEGVQGGPPAPPQPPFAQRPHSREESRYRQSPGPPPDLNEQRPPQLPVAGRQPSASRVQQRSPQMGSSVQAEEGVQDGPPVLPLPSFAQRPQSREESRNQQSPGPPPDRSEQRPSQPPLIDRAPSPGMPSSRRFAPSPQPSQEPKRPYSPPASEKSQPEMNVKPLAISNKASPPQPNQEPMRPRSPPASEMKPAEDVREEDAEQYRPGLGPMIKKNAVRDRFMRAANTANAFKPRPGGAAEKILKAKAEREGGNVEPDGITAVVPRPSTAQVQEGERVSFETPIVEISSPVSPLQVKSTPNVMDSTPHHHQVSLTDEGPQPARLKTPDKAVEEDKADEQQGGENRDDREEEQDQARQPQRKVKKRSELAERYLAELGIKSSLLEGKGLGFGQTLEDFGWEDEVLQPQALAAMEAKLSREHARLEAGSWLTHTNTDNEETLEQLDNMFDKAIAECEAMDRRLTLFSVELGSLTDDVSFIEAQGQGLQVQSANQKVLYNELSNLLETVNLDSQVFEILRYGNFADMAELAEIESCLVKLHDAMVVIDPPIQGDLTIGGKPKNRLGLSDEDAVAISNMRAVRDKKDAYKRESDAFMNRLMQHLDSLFTSAFAEAQTHAYLPMSAGMNIKKPNQDAFVESKRSLWVYAPVLAYVKEMNPTAWAALLNSYCLQGRPVYAQTFEGMVASWKQAERAGEKPLNPWIHFTHVDITESAVKRSKTTRNRTGAARTSLIRMPLVGPAEVFARVIDDMLPVMRQEQTSISKLFQSPSGVMGDVFSPVALEARGLVEWTAKDDPIQLVGVLACITRNTSLLQNIGQEYLLETFMMLGARASSLWDDFIEAQVRAIDETNVIAASKHKGLVRSIEVFPNFCIAVENVASPEVRSLVDAAYKRIYPAIVERLRNSTKRNTVAPIDPEDKELLHNYIFTIINFHHLVSELAGEAALAAYLSAAISERRSAVGDYVAMVIRRPLGKLLDLLDGRGELSHKAAQRLISQYDSREMRRSIDAMKKRVDKHFGEGGGGGGGVEEEGERRRALVAVVWTEVESAVALTFDRTETLVREVYRPVEGEKDVVMAVDRADIAAWFRA